MTNAEIKKRAQELFTKGMGFSVPLTKIRLLEASMDGSYIFFAVGKVAFAYENAFGEKLTFYPDFKCNVGLKLDIKEV